MKIEHQNLYFLLRKDPHVSYPSHHQSIDSIKQLGEKWLIDEAYSNQLIFDIFNIDQNRIGFFQFSNIKWINRKAEITFVIFAPYQNKGFGKMLMKPMLSLAFDTYNFHRLEAEVYETNTISIHLLEKAGFIPEGRKREAKFQDGKYIDILCYGLLAKEFKSR